MNWRRLAFYALLGIAAVLVVGRALSGIVADFLWYDAHGAQALWREMLLARLALDGGAFVLGTAFVAANLQAVRASILKLLLPRRVANVAFAEEVSERALSTAVALLSFGLGLLLVAAQAPWTTFVLARHLPLWGKADEYLERDLSFYLGWFPVETGWYRWALVTLAVTAAVVLVLYALSGSVRWERGALHLTRHARRHVFTLGSLLLLLLAWGFRLGRYERLLESSGGFGLLDHVPGLTTAIVLSLLYIAAAVLVFWAGWSGQVRIAFGVVTTLVAITLVLRHLLPAVYGWTYPISNEEVRNRPYLETRNGYTQQAYALDSLILGEAPPLYASLEALAAAVPSWEPLPLALALQRSTARGEVIGAIGHTTQGGELRQLLLERRLPDDSAAAAPAAWAVLAATPMSAGADGRAPLGGVDARPLPPVLVHPQALGYLVIRDDAERVLAPAVGSGIQRVVHAWATQNLRLAFGDLPASARIVSRRDVRERVQTLTPFFEVAATPAVGVHADSLYWILHLYSASATYPLSRRLTVNGETWSYFRYAATAFVNAHSGRVLVARGVGDPIANTWFRRFPELFVPWSAIPPALVAATPPPIESALTQARAFAEVGARVAPRPVGRVLWPSGGDSLVRGTTAALEAAPDGVLQVAIPLLRRRDDRLAGLVLARGGERPGAYFVPAVDTLLHWYPAAEQLRAFQNDAAQRAADGRVIGGTVRAVAMDQGIVLLQTFYAWSTTEPPRLAGVALRTSDGDARFAPSVPEAAHASMPPVADTVATLSDAEWRERAAALYDSARAALRRGDWPAFGEAYDALGRLLGRPPL